MPIVWMLCGPVCVGKSTFRATLDPEAVVASTDWFIESIGRLRNKTYNEIFQEVISQAEFRMKDDVANAIKAKRNIIWDQTNLTLKVREKKLKVFDDTDYHKVGIFFINATKELIMSRNIRPGKIIPEEVIDRMLKQYEYPTGNELGPLDEAWFVDAASGNRIS